MTITKFNVLFWIIKGVKISEASVQRYTESTGQFAVENLEIKKEALELSENIAQKNEIKFFEGLTTSFDLSQAQQQLYVAQQDYLQSMLNILIKRIDLEALINPPYTN